MNIASFLLPKAEVAYLRDDMTLRQGLEKLRRSGFAAIPVIDGEDRYVGVISVRDFLQNGKVRPACIDTAMENLLEQAKNQNFVPVIDDRNVFIGIVTRSDIIKYFVDKANVRTEEKRGHTEDT